MLFTWDTKNLCIIFETWHVRGPGSFLLSLVAIVVICAGYEALREAIRQYEAFLAKQDETTPSMFLFFQFSYMPPPSPLFLSSIDEAAAPPSSLVLFPSFFLSYENPPLRLREKEGKN